MKRSPLFPALLIGVLLMAGCASSGMQPVTKQAVDYRPASNEATIIFLRTGFYGGAILASVFDVTNEETKFIGISAKGTQIAYKTTPGKKMFMVVSESADFLRADLAGGKTYYALVTARMGVWRARFSLNPVTKDEQHQDRFQKNRATVKFVENTEKSRAWAEKNAPSIQEKREANMPRWIEKYGTDTYGLSPEDGM